MANENEDRSNKKKKTMDSSIQGIIFNFKNIYKLFIIY